MEENGKDLKVIDLRVIFKKMIANKRLYLKTLPIVFVVSCIYILGIPRTYTSETKLAPEIDNSLSGGTLGSIAASFGFDLSDMQTTDAITPLLYPDLMEDNGFVASLFKIQVESADGDIKCNYYEYLKSHQKPSIWSIPFLKLKELFKSNKSGAGGAKEFDPYYLSKRDNDVAEGVRGNIKLSVDKKTGVITISTKAQDALICKTIADSTSSHLQDFITEYRTNKARTDYEYYKKLSADAKQEYEKKRQQYAGFADASTHASLKSVELLLEDMENEMQLKWNAYSTINTQVQASKAKVQERTPVFTVLKGAAVPVKASGPKRIIFVIGMLFLAFFATTFYLVRKDLHFSF